MSAARVLGHHYVPALVVQSVGGRLTAQRTRAGIVKTCEATFSYADSALCHLEQSWSTECSTPRRYTDKWDGDQFKGSPVNELTVILAVSVLTPLAGLAFAYFTFGTLWG